MQYEVCFVIYNKCRQFLHHMHLQVMGLQIKIMIKIFFHDVLMFIVSVYIYFKRTHKKRGLFTKSNVLVVSANTIATIN